MYPLPQCRIKIADYYQCSQSWLQLLQVVLQKQSLRLHTLYSIAACSLFLPHSIYGTMQQIGKICPFRANTFILLNRGRRIGGSRYGAIGIQYVSAR